MKENGQLHALATLSLGRELLNPLNRRLGGPQSQSKHCGEENNLSPCWESNTNSPTFQLQDLIMPHNIYFSDYKKI
jgi:hypothetical protein